jgi:uncharacterized protein YlaI
MNNVKCTKCERTNSCINQGVILDEERKVKKTYYLCKECSHVNVVETNWTQASKQYLYHIKPDLWWEK